MATMGSSLYIYPRSTMTGRGLTTPGLDIVLALVSVPKKERHRSRREEQVSC